MTFSYGGRTVVATVDDRGPYVGGRTWDLNQNTAAALGLRRRGHRLGRLLVRAWWPPAVGRPPDFAVWAVVLA